MTTPAIIASIGDSWTHQYVGWLKQTAQAIKATYGDAGPGWVGLASHPGGAGYAGNVDNAVCTPTYPNIADWVRTGYAASVSPDSSSISSSVVGARITVTNGPAGMSAVSLFARATADGNIRYRFGAGAWTALSLEGSGLTVLSLDGLPATVWTLDLEVVSGTATLLGLDVHSTAPGVRWHKLAASGSSAASWVTHTGSDWGVGLTALAPGLVTIMLGTNDQGAGATPATFKANLQTLIDRVRAALPGTDILLIAACENQRGLPVLMSDYAQAIGELAATNHAVSIDLQPFFGAAPADYAFGSATPLFLADGVHPDAAGGAVIRDAVVDTIARWVR